MELTVSNFTAHHNYICVCHFSTSWDGHDYFDSPSISRSLPSPVSGAPIPTGPICFREE